MIKIYSDIIRPSQWQPIYIVIPGRPSMDILVRSWQELQDVMVGSYQESHVSKKTFIVKSYLERKKSERKSTKINISADLYC